MDDWEVFEWLVEEGGEGGAYRGAAADMLCCWLEAIVDGESAMHGGPTDLPRPEGMTDEQYRLTILDIDRDRWSWVEEVVRDSPASARALVNMLKEEKNKGDWHTPGEVAGRDRFVAILRGVVGFYGQRRAVEQDTED